MRLLAISALALVAATPAFAQDEAAATFTGPRFEGVVGWDHVGAEGEGESGVVYGGAVGYDVQLNNIVLGAEAELTDSSVEEAGVSAGRDIFVGGRIGFAAGNTLFYGKGGYTNARINIVGFGGEDFDGYRVGAGVEHNFGRFYGKVEYRYSRYEELDLNRDAVVAGVGIRF
ncbi:MAG: porin family protein [Sphingomonadales bacterium]|nr:MAG: porin family protein [Sphingomonadales bacterium]